MQKITLKQQTDMIHFQANEYSILRMSEIKPRLTKFIKDELKNIDNNLYTKYKHIIENKEIFTQKGCGFFKLRTNLKKVEISEYGTYPKNNNKIGSYFARAKAVNFDEIEIEVFSLIKDLEELVAKSMKYFFILYNIGQRQTKGFGGFILKDTTQDEFEKILKQKYQTIYKKTSNNPLKMIHEDYQLLKSGRNNPYKKSLLFEYFCNKHIRWEKRKIKQELSRNYKLKSSHRAIDGSRDNYNYKYIRAMLGVAGSFSFLLEEKNEKKQNKRLSLNVAHKYKNKKEKIERFNSPILFKVFDNTIYALPNKIPQEIFNQEFILKLDTKALKKQKLKIVKDFEIKSKTPTKEEFDLIDFFNYGFKKLNWSRL